MKTKFIVILSMLLFGLNKQTIAQSTLITKTGEAHFYSKAPLEDIEASNNKVTAAIDFSNGDVVVKMLIKDFNFDNSLMQEHFNENYMESDKYPNAIFLGKLKEYEKIDLETDGVYEVTLLGELDIHGVKNPLQTKGQIKIENGKMAADTKFSVMTADHKIKIPRIVIKNIAEKIDVTIKLGFDTRNL